MIAPRTHSLPFIQHTPDATTLGHHTKPDTLPASPWTHYTTTNQPNNSLIFPRRSYTTSTTPAYFSFFFFGFPYTQPRSKYHCQQLRDKRERELAELQTQAQIAQRNVKLVSGIYMDFQISDFDIDDDDDNYFVRPAPTRHKNLHEDEDILELIWQNGQIVAQIQNQSIPATMPPAPQPVSCDHLFMQEDEMAAWLHYSADNSQIYHDVLAPPPSPQPQPQPQPAPPQPSSSATSSTVTALESRPTAAPTETRKPPIPPPSARNFAHFSRVRVQEDRPAASTVVDSNETPAIPLEIRSPAVDGGGCKTVDGASSAGGGERREVKACGGVVVSSSPGIEGEGVKAAEEGKMKPPSVHWKRKGREGDDFAAAEDVDKESVEAKRIPPETTRAKRSRAAEVHSLSERKRRDRINDRMRTLQQLIPSCAKSDKASMLDEAIRYTNQLQMQVRMMAMGYGMPPMMFPGVHQYMTPTGMGMGMEATMGLNRLMMPFPHMFPGMTYPPLGSAPPLGPRFPLPSFPMPGIPAPDPSRAEASNQADPIHSMGLQNSNMFHHPYVADPNYQQYLATQQMQGKPPLHQEQPSSGPSSSKPSKN